MLGFPTLDFPYPNTVKTRPALCDLPLIEESALTLRSPEQARRELAAIKIQSNLRRMFAQKQLVELRCLRDEALALQKRNQGAAVLIQSLARMREGR